MSSSIAANGYRLEAPSPGTANPGQPDAVIAGGIGASAMPPLHRKHRGRARLLSLLVAVALPAALMATYLYGYASDQYVTEFRFSVRHQAPMRMEPAGSAASALSGGGGGGSPILAVITDSQIVVQYLKSRQIIDDITASGIDLDAIYAGRDKDFLAHLTPGATAEERLIYWRRMVDPYFDMSTGIVSVEVHAFRPEDSRLVAARTLELAEKLVNDLSARAHADSLAYAEQEVAASHATLRSAQAAIAAYRNQHAVLFPEMQATADSAVGGHVEESLIEAKSNYNAQLAQGVARDAIPMTILRNRIAALQTELAGVHGTMARTSSAAAASGDASLASVMSGYSGLEVDEQIAAKVFERALMGLQDARNEASQQSIYLAAFVRPSLPQESRYPIRWRMMLETVLLSFAGWCLLQLLYHGIRDHID